MKFMVTRQYFGYPGGTDMGIPATISAFLDSRDIDYSVVSHPHSESSMRTAEAAQVSGERVAKAVLLKDQEGYLLAVLPASFNVHVGTLRELLGRPVELAPETDLAGVFPDCALGAVPALGPAYDIPTVVDDSLVKQPEVYFEAGDHEELIRVTGAAFADLLDQAEHLTFGLHKS
jgi:Ala-tRNA(Pro) deacylase